MGVSTFPASSGGGGASFKQITKRITSTQSFTVPADVTSVNLILCGGGSGGSVDSIGGGGGGGSVYESSGLAVTAGASYTITIGAGGPSRPANTQATGRDGNPSSFGSLFIAETIYFSTNQRRTGKVGSGLGGSGGSRDSSGSIQDGLPGAFGLGGGGGNGSSSAEPRSGATNGGGVGSLAGEAAQNGVINTGGGGGGSVTAIASGSGGSGVCIIKYWSAL